MQEKNMINVHEITTWRNKTFNAKIARSFTFSQRIVKLIFIKSNLSLWIKESWLIFLKSVKKMLWRLRQFFDSQIEKSISLIEFQLEIKIIFEETKELQNFSFAKNELHQRGQEVFRGSCAHLNVMKK